jgi:hypothetical protein
MPQLPRESQLNDKIAQGVLPPRAPSVVVWAGFGTGESCSACDAPITVTETEYEVPERRRDGTPFRFHIGCYEVWKSLCVSVHIESRAALPQPSQAAQAPKS